MCEMFTAVPTIIEGPSDQDVVVSQPAMFQCMATGVPAPEILWTVGEKLLMNSTETMIRSTSDGFNTTSYLTIREASLEYNGATVTCTAENVVDSVNASATLTVLCKSAIRMSI